MSDIILDMVEITKEFSGVKALNKVNISIRRGEIHALMGENGAGKSTLMNVLSGVYPFGTYTGSIIYEKDISKYKSIKDSERDGIVIIHQELALIPYLSIHENVFLGNERQSSGVINWNETKKKTKEVLQKVGLYEDSNKLIKDIGVGKQQLVEIAKALTKDVKILILDEPTAALNDEESNKLLELILKLKEEGITSIIISHKLNEILKVADRITIIRDGMTIETIDKDVEEISEERIIKGMVGRDLVDRYPKRNSKKGDILFEVKNWNVYNGDKKSIKNVNFNVRRGEVIGIAGLMGAGRTELAMSIFGKTYGSKFEGELILDSNKININNVNDAIKHGLAYVTEDRKNYGLILMNSIKENITLSSLQNISRYGVLDKNKEIQVASEYKEKLNIKSSSIIQSAGSLSGGNQQKIVISKWLLTEPKVLILDEPTRGIDVGAKYEIYTIINELVNQGKAVIVISSELTEVLGISDRVYVMNEGSFVGELDIKDATSESIMKCIMDDNGE